MLADRAQEAVQRADMLEVALTSAHLGVQAGQVAFRQRPVQVRQAPGGGWLGGEEAGEPGQDPDCCPGVLALARWPAASVPTF
jgi:hypothetical protein